MAMPKKEVLSDTEVRVQVPLSAEAVRKIDDLAERLNVGRGRMAAMLLEEGIQDNEWMIRVVTSDFTRPLLDMIRRWDKGKGKKAGAREAKS